MKKNEIELDLVALAHEMNSILRNIEDMKTRRRSTNMEEIRSRLSLLKTKYNSPYRFGDELPPLRRSTSPLFFEERKSPTHADNECRSPISKARQREANFSPYSPIVLK
jgi:hypothetical protein